MSDGIDLNAGSGGAKLATDITTDIGGVSMHVQRVKVGYGGDSAYTDVQDSPGSGLPVEVIAELPAGTQLLGRVSLDPQAANGCSTYRRIADASTNALCPNAGACTLYGIIVACSDTAVQSLHLYDLAVPPTVGTSEIKMSVAASGIATGTTQYLSFPMGIKFENGLAMAIVPALTGASANATADKTVVTLIFKA